MHVYSDRVLQYCNIAIRVYVLEYTYVYVLE